MEIGSQFESIGIKIPKKRVSTKEIVNKLKIRAATRFERFTGIKERRVCREGEDSFTLAVNAARDCLEHSRYLPRELDMLICCSISKFKDGLSFLYEPPLSLCIKDAIGAVNAFNFDISNACAGMLTGVYIADDFIQRGAIRTCMVVSGEYISNLGDNAIRTVRTATSPQLASLTLGDAGAAVILERTPEGVEGLSVSNFTTLSGYNKLCVGGISRKFPGGVMKTKTREIHQAAISESPPLLKKALEKSGLSYDQIDYLVPHQTSRSSIYSGARHLSNYFNVNPGQVVCNLEEYGNTASTTHFLALYRYLQEKRFKKGDRVMLLCLASGLVIGTVIFTMNEIVERYGNKN